jgi:hypothetical protein
MFLDGYIAAPPTMTVFSPFIILAAAGSRKLAEIISVLKAANDSSAMRFLDMVVSRLTVASPAGNPQTL